MMIGLILGPNHPRVKGFAGLFLCALCAFHEKAPSSQAEYCKLGFGFFLPSRAAHRRPTGGAVLLQRFLSMGGFSFGEGSASMALPSPASLVRLSLPLPSALLWTTWARCTLGSNFEWVLPS
jgi:hypothetical protein